MSFEKTLGWLREAKELIWRWMERLRVAGHPGWIRFCEKGALLEPGPRAGLGISCLALKICLMLGLERYLARRELDEWIEFIRSFQKKNGRFKGFFEDMEVTKAADMRIGWFKKDVGVRRAETRQACATLLFAGSAPKYPVDCLPRNTKELRDFVGSLDWSNPWGAGSHVGHLLFLYEMNARLFGSREKIYPLIEEILTLLKKLQDKKTGSWHKGVPNNNEIINGAMKIITGYRFLGKQFRFPERLIDICLSSRSLDNGCNIADVIYVLYECSRQTDYRINDIEDLFRQCIHHIKKLHRSDGAFSYFIEKAQTHYYGVKVSKGLPESDIHGTALIVWSLVMIGDLLGFREELGWRLPVT